MLKISLWGFDTEYHQTEYVHWYLDKIGNTFIALSNFSIDTPVLNRSLLDLCSSLEAIELILNQYPKEINPKVKFLCNCSTTKVIKINIQQKSFIKGRGSPNNLVKLLEVSKGITNLDYGKYHSMIALINYLEAFLKDSLKVGYLVIQGDIYDIPKYLVQKQSNGIFNKPKPLTSQSDNSNIKSPSKNVNSLFS